MSRFEAPPPVCTKAILMPSRLPRETRHIKSWDGVAKLGQHAVNLASVMGLMIEHRQQHVPTQHVQISSGRSSNERIRSGYVCVLERVHGFNDVKVTIGGVEAAVFFSGLSPGLANLYQINAIVPEGVASGRQVKVQLEVAGQKSPTVTMAVAQ